MTTTASTIVAKRFELGALNDPSSLIGQGGMGAVYFGKDRQTGDKVAVKVLKSEIIAKDTEMLARFIREGEALAKLNHPNIVKNLGAFEENGIHYLVMEYVTGGSLRDLLRKKQRLSVQQTLYIALDLADALTRAHRLEIMHRDIKPDNVLVAEDGTPRLTDFGMARMGGSHLTQDGAVIGTLAYMAPELFEGQEADEKSDIWSFGVMLFEMLTGERPFPFEQPAQLINAILTHPIADLEGFRKDIPTGLIDLIYRMLNKNHHARVPSVRLIGAELEAIIRGGASTLQSIVDTETGRFENITPTPHPAAPTSQMNIPTNLPAQPTAFIGRENELQALQTLLDNPTYRLITLVAPGGMGKTRLAVELAEKQFRRFPDGVFLISLANIAMDAQLFSAVAESMGFTLSGSADPKTELTNYLREKSVLLIIDNFELCLESVNQIADVLQAAPNLKIIATSRERLRIRSEQVFELGGLPVPVEGRNRVETLEKLASVQLFVQSARRAVPDFELDDTTAEHVNNITRLVDGMPLAIELAAGWLEMLGIEEIATEIERSIDFLESNLRDVPERQRSVRAVFEYSWNLMTEEEREVFLRLSVFQGGFEREAAQRISNASLKVLTNLVNKSLLQRDPQGRYTPHKMLRQYAAERFTDDPKRKETLIAHSRYYADFLEKIEPALNSSREREALDALDRELDNLRAAWQFGIETEAWDILERALQPISLYFASRSLAREGSYVFGMLAEVLEKKGQRNTPFYWRIRIRQGALIARLGEYDASFQWGKGGYDFFKDRGDSIEIAYALGNMSYACMMQGKLQESYEYSAQANEIIGDQVNHPAWFLSMGNLGYAAYLMGNYQEARMIYESILHTRDNGLDLTMSGVGFAKNNLGEILRSLGETDEAAKLFKEAHLAFESIQHWRGMGFTLSNLAGILMTRGKIEEAKGKYERAYEIAKEIGDRPGIGHALSALGNIASLDNKFDEARRYFDQALRLRREMGDRRATADSLGDLARIELNQRHYDAATRHINESLLLYQEVGDREGQAFDYLMRAIARYRSNQMDGALNDVEHVMEIGRAMNNPVIMAQAYQARGDVELYNQNQDQALMYYREALRGVHQANFQGLVLLALVSIAGIYLARGQSERALRIISVTMRYPRNYLAEVEQRAQDIFQQLQALLPANMVETSLQQSTNIELSRIVDEELAEII